MNIQWMVSGLLLLSGHLMGCGAGLPQPPPALASQQPILVAVQPLEEISLPATPRFELTFSQPLHPASVGSESLVVVPDVDPAESTAAIVEKLAAGDYAPLPTEIQLSADMQAVTVAPTVPLHTATVALVVTDAIRSITGLPFASVPGGGAGALVLRYGVESAPDPLIPPDTALSPAAPTAADAFGTVGTADDPVAAVSAPGTTGSGPGTAEQPTVLVLNEILYDIPGSDTNGDCFVELRGTPGADLGGYVVRFINGDGGKPTESIQIPAGLTMPADGLFVIADGVTGDPHVTHLPSADLVDNFDAQNGPDAVQLLAPDGTLLDAIGYGNPLPLRDVDALLLYEGLPGPDAPAGQSISRRADGADTDNNAADWVVLETPSPGAP
ncbi:MAG: hypothetical protein HY696_03740 [Deltaproteobacteria bacterium]|nr:hypothetical protein [Deltaproteobacteria bacterium]